MNRHQVSLLLPTRAGSNIKCSGTAHNSNRHPPGKGSLSGLTSGRAYDVGSLRKGSNGTPRNHHQFACVLLSLLSWACQDDASEGGTSAPIGDMGRSIGDMAQVGPDITLVQPDASGEMSDLGMVQRGAR